MTEKKQLHFIYKGSKYAVCDFLTIAEDQQNTDVLTTVNGRYVHNPFKDKIAVLVQKLPLKKNKESLLFVDKDELFRNIKEIGDKDFIDVTYYAEPAKINEIKY